MNLSDIDLQVFHRMRVDTIQEVIDMVAMENPPKNSVEYEMSKVYIMETISAYQPMAFEVKPRQVRFAVKASHELEPIELVDGWVRLALLSLATSDYEATDFYLNGALETAMQFTDDNLLVFAAKLSFPIGARANHDEVYANRFGVTCRACINTILSHDKNKGIEKTTRKNIIEHCGMYYLTLGSINEWLTKRTQTSKETALSSALSIDKYNNKKLDMVNWTIIELL